MIWIYTVYKRGHMQFQKDKGEQSDAHAFKCALDCGVRKENNHVPHKVELTCPKCK